MKSIRILLLLLLLIVITCHGRQADQRSKFLYRQEEEEGENNNNVFVLEYEHHMHIAPHYVEVEETVEEQQQQKHPLQTFVEDQHHHLDENTKTIDQTLDSIPHYRRPFFLRRTYPIPRVVQFYSPWCGLCQGLVPIYLKVAQFVLERLPQPHALEFYAVSCSEHRVLCTEEDDFDTIRHYPTIRMYLPTSTTSTTITREEEFVELSFQNFSVATIEEVLPFALVDKKSTSTSSGGDGEEEEILKQQQQQQQVSLPKKEKKKKKTIDILGATQDGFKHTRTDVYRDAALSLTYALEHHIYNENNNMENANQPASLLLLTPEQAHAFLEWLDLLHWTLPPTWMVHTLLNDLRQNTTAIITSKEILVSKVKKHLPVIHNHHLEWSEGCGGGGGGGSESSNILSSFSCGMWSLFHIIGCGVYERHSSVLGHKDRVSTYHAAETLMNYMKYFFGSWCTQCRDQALELYHNCAFRSCTRFLHRSSSSSTEHLWSWSSSNSQQQVTAQQQQRRRKSKTKTKPPPDEHWKEFPLWLYEFHNEINERLLTKEARKLYKRLPTIAEYHYAQWPPSDACPLCYSNEGQKNQKRQRKVNHRYLYDYIREEYWPTGIQNFRYVVLDAAVAVNNNEEDEEEDVHYYYYYHHDKKKKKKNWKSRILYFLRYRIYQPLWEEIQYILYYYTISWRKHPWFRYFFHLVFHSYSTILLLLLLLLLLLIGTVIRQRQRQSNHAQRLYQTGKHKKYDDYLFLQNEDDDDTTTFVDKTL